MLPEFRYPDQFVSIGTGACRTRHVADTKSQSSFFFGDNSLRPTLQHYGSENFSGDRQFVSTRNTMAVVLPEGASEIDDWFRRFNLPLEGELPNLADVQAIDGLADAAWTHFTSDPALHDLALAVLASNFYPELRCMPIYENGHYSCYGRILCRIPVSKPVFSALMNKLSTMGARFLVQNRKSRASRPMTTSSDHTGNFSWPFSLRVRDLEDQLDIRLEFSDTHSYHISTCPLPINSFIKLQRLEWRSLSHTRLHGRHDTRKRPSSPCLSLAVRRRRSKGA